MAPFQQNTVKTFMNLEVFENSFSNKQWVLLTNVCQQVKKFIIWVVISL